MEVCADFTLQMTMQCNKMIGRRPHTSARWLTGFQIFWHCAMLNQR